MTHVVLFGTSNSKWKLDFKKLVNRDSIYIQDTDTIKWDDEAKEFEKLSRENAEYLFYTITPEMKGFYTIAEVVADSNLRPKKTLFCFLEDYADTSFTKEQIDQMKKVKALVTANGAHSFDHLSEVAEFLKGKQDDQSRDKTGLNIRSGIETKIPLSLSKKRLFDSSIPFIFTPQNPDLFLLAESVDQSFKDPDHTVVCFLDHQDGQSFTEHQIKGNQMIGKMIRESGATYLENMEQLKEYYAKQAREVRDGKRL